MRDPATIESAALGQESSPDSARAEEERDPRDATVGSRSPESPGAQEEERDVGGRPVDDLGAEAELAEEWQEVEDRASGRGPDVARGGRRATAPAETAGEREAALQDQLLRLRAEFDNYRKRQSRERAESWGRAKADLIEKLLGSIDDLSRVAHPDTAPPHADSQAAAVLEGVELVLRKMLQTLEREGLEPIDAEGARFDPAVHEAILTQPTREPQRDDQVAQVISPGYRFADRLLRPAKVVVWKHQR